MCALQSDANRGVFYKVYLSTVPSEKTLIDSVSAEIRTQYGQPPTNQDFVATQLLMVTWSMLSHPQAASKVSR